MPTAVPVTPIRIPEPATAIANPPKPQGAAPFRDTLNGRAEPSTQAGTDQTQKPPADAQGGRERATDPAADSEESAGVDTSSNPTQGKDGSSAAESSERAETDVAREESNRQISDGDAETEQAPREAAEGESEPDAEQRSSAPVPIQVPVAQPSQTVERPGKAAEESDRPSGTRQTRTDSSPEGKAERARLDSEPAPRGDRSDAAEREKTEGARPRGAEVRSGQPTGRTEATPEQPARGPEAGQGSGVPVRAAGAGEGDLTRDQAQGEQAPRDQARPETETIRRDESPQEAREPRPQRAERSEQQAAPKDQGQAKPDAPAQIERLASAGTALRERLTSIAESQQKPTGDADGSRSPAARLVAQSVSRGVAAALNQRGGEVTLKLSPESLGTVRVHMSLDRGVVSVRIEASTQSAHSLLSDGVAQLKGSLETRGLSVERISIQHAPAASGTSGAQSSPNSWSGSAQHGSQDQGGQEHDAGGSPSRGGSDEQQEGSGERFDDGSGSAEALESAFDHEFEAQVRLKLEEVA